MMKKQNEFVPIYLNFRIKEKRKMTKRFISIKKYNTDRHKTRQFYKPISKIVNT